MDPLSGSVFRRNSFLVVAFIIISSVKVLAAVDQQKPPHTAGQQWYEKGWRPTTSADYGDSSSDRSRTRTNERGSGAEPGGTIGDLDDGASGFGEDDEDADVEGSGTDSRGRFDTGSGDISLPPTSGYPSSELPTEETLVDPVHPPTVTSLPTTTAQVVTMEEVDTTPLYTVHMIPESPSTTTPPTTRRTTVTPKMFPTEKTTTSRRTTTTTTKTVPTSYSTQSTTASTSPKLADPKKTTPPNFWMRPGVLAGLIGGAVAGLLAAILLVMFVVYRMRKKDEGSYALEEPKSPPTYAYAYQKAPTREFYA